MSGIILFSVPSPQIKEEIRPHIFSKSLKPKPVLGYMASDGSDTASVLKYSPEWKEYSQQNGAEFKLINNSQLVGNQLEIVNILVITGGNTFKLRKLLKENGFDEEIKRFHKNGGIIVAFSAGAIVLSPSLETATQSDNKEVNLKDLSGLGLFDFLIVPHADNKEAYIQELERKCKKFKAIKNSEYIII